MRLLLFLPTTTYRTEAFVEAAARLGMELTIVTEEPQAFASNEPAAYLSTDFYDPDLIERTVRAFADQWPVDAVFGVDDDTAVAATVAACALGLPNNPLAAVEAARDKYVQRCAMRDAGVPVPNFELHALSEDGVPLPALRYPTSTPDETRTSDVGHRIAYPVVLKPLRLSASRGVMRANDHDEYRVAVARLARVLSAPDVAGPAGSAQQRFLVEAFVPGPEFALEGLVHDGRLKVLALWDKPDPLDGPYFEETIYVTPSAAEMHVQAELAACAQRAVEAVGLLRGPVHIELRYNEAGPWLIELAARPIGGKCGQALRFGLGGEMSLEEVLLADASGMLESVPSLDPGATGVMMVPVPKAGAYQGVAGIDDAKQVRGVTDIVISAHRGQRVVPLPDESRYLGFVFARGTDASEVTRALRDAFARLEFVIGDAPD